MTCFPPPCKPMLGSLTLVGFILFLLVVGSLEREATATTTARLATQSGGSFKEAEGVGGTLLHPEWHLNYMSKRRVPNGPDPIHNRRAGNSGRPPGKA